MCACALSAWIDAWRSLHHRYRCRYRSTTGATGHTPRAHRTCPPDMRAEGGGGVAVQSPSSSLPPHPLTSSSSYLLILLPRRPSAVNPSRRLLRAALSTIHMHTVHMLLGAALSTDLGRIASGPHCIWAALHLGRIASGPHCIWARISSRAHCISGSLHLISGSLHLRERRLRGLPLHRAKILHRAVTPSDADCGRRSPQGQGGRRRDRRDQS